MGESQQPQRLKSHGVGFSMRMVTFAFCTAARCCLMSNKKMQFVLWMLSRTPPSQIRHRLLHVEPSNLQIEMLEFARNIIHQLVYCG